MFLVSWSAVIYGYTRTNDSQRVYHMWTARLCTSIIRITISLRTCHSRSKRHLGCRGHVKPI
jgi:hypothetical protein